MVDGSGISIKIVIELELTRGVNTMPTDVPAPKVTNASAGMALAVWDRQHVFLLQI